MRHSTTEVFTPATVARLTFVEREAINKRLVTSLRTPGKQIVIFGRSGCGKTTLLENKLTQVYAMHFKTPCLAGTTYESLLIDAFDQLEPRFIDEKTTCNETSRDLKATIRAVGDVRVQLGAASKTSNETTTKRVLPPQLTASFLVTLLGATDSCWVVEDLHKAPPDTRQKIAQTMKLFMDAADRFPDARLIVVGAVGAARDLLSLDPELWHRASEIEVSLMDSGEILEIIRRGEELLNVSFPKQVRDLVVHFSNGLPAVAHQLCLNMCNNANIDETVAGDSHTFTDDDFAEALSEWIADAGDSLRSTYDVAVRAQRARKYDNRRIVLHALATLGAEGATHGELLDRIHKDHPEYPAGNLSNYLKELMTVERGSALVVDQRSGRYSFESPMFCAYVRARAKEHHPAKQQRSIQGVVQPADIARELMKLFASAPIAEGQVLKKTLIRLKDTHGPSRGS